MYMNEANLKPVWMLAEIYHEIEGSQSQATKRVKRPKIKIRIEQDGFNLDYTKELRNYNNRIMLYNENKHKAYVVIFAYCNKVMQSQIEESLNFGMGNWNDLLKLLNVIKLKMYDPARVKYKFVLSTKFLLQVLTTLQSQDKNLMDYMKRFKQVRDIIWSSMGEEILDGFVETTREYLKAPND